MTGKGKNIAGWLRTAAFIALLIPAICNASNAYALDEMTAAEYEEYLDECVEEMTDEELEWFGDDIDTYGVEIVDDPEYGRKLHREEYMDHMEELEDEDGYSGFTGMSAKPRMAAAAPKQLGFGGVRTGAVSKLSTSISPFTGKTYTHSANFDGYTIQNWVDLSYCDPNANFSKMKSSGAVDGVVIRLGRTGYSASGFNRGVDAYFEQHYKNAIAAGYSSVDIYYFSQAVTVEEARAEADYCISHLSGKKIGTVYFDYEYAYVNGGDGGRLYDAHLSQNAATQNALAFCKRIANAGYGAGVYANRYFFTDQLIPSQIASSYRIWVAEYKTKTYYTSTGYTMWQYSESGTIPGNNRPSDCNFRYVKQDRSAKSITVSKSSATVSIGSSVTLTASVNPTNSTDSVSWSSSNTAVATVSGGKVTAVSAGTATITAKAGKVSATCTITVPAPVQSITLTTGLITFGPNMVNGVNDATLTFKNSDPAKSLSVPVKYAAGGSSASVTLRKDTTYTLTISKGSHTSYTDKSFNPATDKLPAVTLYSGDIDGSGKIDLTDAAIISSAYSSVAGGSGYNSAADLSGDGRIDLVDVSILSGNYGKGSTVIE